MGSTAKRPRIAFQCVGSIHALAEPHPSQSQAGRRLVSAFLFHPQRGDATSRDDLHSATVSDLRAGRLLFGGRMLFTTALVLMVAWLLGVLGVYTVGKSVHVLLLISLLLMLLALVKARDAELRRLGNGPSDNV